MFKTRNYLLSKHQKLLNLKNQLTKSKNLSNLDKLSSKIYQIEIFPQNPYKMTKPANLFKFYQKPCLHPH